MSSFLSLFQVSAPAAQATGSENVRADRAGGSGDTIANAFASASQTTGLPFDYFMTTAMRESSLDVNAAAATSSARGPFQFIEQTWLGMVHQHGAELGLAQEAASIERQSNGRFSVSDPQMRQDLLAMRHDPELSAVMSGLYLQGNAAELEMSLGREISIGEGYVAHVFGPSGATRLISLAEQQPNRVAADVFPTQAAANRGLFYNRSGEPVSVSQLYNRLVDGFPNEAVRTDGVMQAHGASRATSDVRTDPLHASQAPVASVAAAPAVPSPVAHPGAQSLDPNAPLELEPEGFDALPVVADRAAPDDLEDRGLFTAGGPATDGRDQMPFFAALYRPDGVERPEIGEEFVATHGQTGNQDGFDRPASGDPFALHQVGGQGGLIPQRGDERLARPAGGLAETMPLDLLQFVQSGTLAERYRNPVRELAGSELVPPV